MKVRVSAFGGDSIKLNFADMVKLLFGGTIKDGAVIIGLWRTPLRFPGDELK